MAAPALTPDLALRYLDELSTDIRASAVLGPGGRVLAHRPDDPAAGRRLGELLTGLLEQAGRAVPEGFAELEASAAGGTVFVVRERELAVGVVAGRFALSSLMRYDLRQVAADLAGRAA